jgi:hypothetical protein
MEHRLESAAIIAASLLRDYSQPSTAKIVELLVQSLTAVDGALREEIKRSAQMHEELRSNAAVVGL